MLTDVGYVHAVAVYMFHHHGRSESVSGGVGAEKLRIETTRHLRYLYITIELLYKYIDR
jgi:hypothetical protein